MFENQFLSGGIVLVLLGGLLAYFKQIPGMIWQQLRSRLVLTLEIVQGDPFYEWVESWLAAQHYSNACRRLAVSCFREGDKSNGPLAESSESRRRGGVAWKTRVTPAPGDHFFRYGGRPVWLRKDRERLKESGTLIGLFETITLTFLTRKRDIALAFLDDVRMFNIPPDDDRLAVYVAQWTSWRLWSLIPQRPVETVVLSDGLLQAMIGDIELFSRSKEWYLEHAIPYRRGYLLHGPPGNGKSATVLALASYFRKDIYILSIGRSMSDDRFVELLLDVPADAMLLIEDIDQSLDPKSGSDKDGDTALTRSCLLNAIDGIAATTGRVLFMTTNYFDRLDEALIRPGRADVTFLIGAPTESQIEAYLGRFFDDSDVVSSIKSRLNGGCMADLQAEVIRERWG